jgi:hypothetical protein
MVYIKYHLSACLEGLRKPQKTIKTRLHANRPLFEQSTARIYVGHVSTEFGANDRKSSEKYELASFTKQQDMSFMSVPSGFAGGMKQKQATQTGTLTHIQSRNYGSLKG